MENKKEHILPSTKHSPRKSKFVGVRQRPSGKWVAEIKNTTQKIRMWLGTFNTAEEAARAYDEAACILRGSNARKNFVNSGPENSALSLKIRNLLIQKKRKQSESCEKNGIGELGLFGDRYEPGFEGCVSQFDQTLVTSEEINRMNGVSECWDNLHVSNDVSWDFSLLSQMFCQR